MTRFRTCVAAAVLALAAPSLAFAADAKPVANPPPGTKPVLVCNGVTQEEATKKKRRGMLVGAAGGALLGGGVAGNGAKTEGAVLGAVVGGATGRHVGKKNAEKAQDCHYEYVKK